MRWWSRLAFVASVGLSAVVACSSVRSDGAGDEQNAGSLALALRATGSSGGVYMLRNARFRITDVHTGDTVKTLKTDAGDPDVAELTTLLVTGNYTVTLLDGWFLERISRGSGGGGFGGSTSPSGGTFGMGTAGTFAKAFDAAGGEATFPIGGDSGVGGEIGFPVEGGAGGGISSPPEAGAPPIPTEGGSGAVDTEIVEAQLLSDAVQFFTIFGGDDAFVHFQFKVGSEVLDFSKGKLHITFGVEEDPADCQVPLGVLRPERMLLESNVAALNGVSLFGVMQALATNGGREDDPVTLFQQIFDSYASADEGRLPDAVHCGDETTDGVPTLNGYPIDCNRAERFQVDNLGSFFPTAFVNRMDLAPANGAHCGQQRMIFASNSFNRAFMIVEAQIPNPAPELGIEGCRPLAQFWLDQNAIDDPFARGNRLAAAFLFGDPDLQKAGFGPFYTAENLTVGSGQIRTNQFDSDPWTLREFKLALDGDTLRALPFPVSESPNGALWNESSGLPQGEACRESFMSALEGVLGNDLSRMSFVVDAACKDAESRNDFSQDYAGQLSDGFRAQLDARLAGTGLSATDVANRARFAGSCIGCHNEASGSFLGNGMFAPFSSDFPQVSEFPQQCTGGEQGSCFPTSNALRSAFLPGRMAVMSQLLGVPNLPNPCNGGGGGFGGSSGFGGSFTTGGSFPTAGTSPAGGAFTGMGGAPGVGEPGPAAEPTPAPLVDIELASASEPIELLQEEDAEIREAYGDVTLSGRSAKVTH